MTDAILPQTRMPQGRIDGLPKSLKIGWASGAFGIALLFNGIGALVFFYMIGILKIEPALAGSLIFVAKLLGAFTDASAGAWSDRLKSPRGRRRPFMFWGAFICAGSFAMIFTTPLFAESWMTSAYVFVALCLFSLGYSVYNVPYLAMPAEMTDSYHERSSIHSYRIIFVTFGGFVAGALAPAAIERLGKTEWSSYALLGCGVAAMMLISLLSAYYTTGSARYTEQGTAKPTIGKDFKEILRNPHFMRLIGVKFAQLTAIQCTQASLLFFLVQSLELKLTVLVPFGAAMTLSSVIAAPLLVRFSKRYGKRGAYFVAATAYVIYSLSWVLAVPGEPIGAIIARGLIVGVAATGNVMLAMSMLTDIINYDGKQTGLKREGSYTAIYTFVEKLTGSMGPLLVGAALSYAGFNNKLPPDVPQSGDVTFALLITTSILPAVLGIVAIAILTGYKLRQEDIEEPNR
jgi:glycoside/pentoside/hexuronide:cation symporter, GPH family